MINGVYYKLKVRIILVLIEKLLNLIKWREL